jgi:hypothetical protein
MTTICKIFCLAAIATLVFILTPVSNHCAAEDPQPTISGQNQLKTDSAKKAKKADASHLELYGTVILGDKKRALIFDNSKQRMDGAQEQDKNKRAGVYYLGDSLGGYVISAIEEKRVVLDYNGEEVILTLSEGKTTNRGDYTPLEEPPASAKEKSREKAGAPKKQDGEKPGSAPKAVIKSPIMSPEEAEEIVEYSKEILEDIEAGGENVDQRAIDLKKEELRKMFMEKLERAEETGKETP